MKCRLRGCRVQCVLRSRGLWGRLREEGSEVSGHSLSFKGWIIIPPVRRTFPQSIAGKKLTLLDNDSLLVAPMRGHPLDPLDAPGSAPVSREAAEPHVAVGAREGIVVVQVEHCVAAAFIVAVAAPFILSMLPLDLYRQ